MASADMRITIFMGQRTHFILVWEKIVCKQT